MRSKGIKLAALRQVILLCFLFVLSSSLAAAAITGCGLSGGNFYAHITGEKPVAVRFRTWDKYSHWRGDQIVFQSSEDTFRDRPFRIYGEIFGDPAHIVCSEVSSRDFKIAPPSMVIDVGNNADLVSLFLEANAASVKLNAFFTEFVVPPPQIELDDDPYYFSIDSSPEVETIVGGGLHRDVIMRFANLSPGEHTIKYGPSGSGTSVTFSLPTAPPQP
jgi:hypothetical protein